jgi:hypothetical protein
MAGKNGDGLTDRGLQEVFTSANVPPNIGPSKREAANVVDVIDMLVSQVRNVANAITPLGASAGEDSQGGHVASLTEAAMGVTASLHEAAGELHHLEDVATSLDNVASALAGIALALGEIANAIQGRGTPGT